MPLKVLISSLMSVSIKHVIAKPDGSLFYKRRTPTDLHPVLGNRPVVRSLKTRDPKVAAVMAQRLDREHEALWASLRSASPGLTFEQTRDAARARLASLGLKPGEAKIRPDGWWSILGSFEREHGHEFQEARHHEGDEGTDMFLTPVNREMERQFEQGASPRAVLLSDARNLYVASAKPEQRENPRFIRDTDRAYLLLKAAVGDLPVEFYTREHARQLRDKLTEGGAKTATVRRQLNPLVAIFSEAIREHGLTIPNHFKALKIVGEGTDVERRHVFTAGELRTIAAACRKVDDYKRHILAMQFDTGARLAEIVGLRVEDVVLDNPVPYVFIREHKEGGRTLKTSTSTRRVPLVGEALWGATRAVQEARKGGRTGGWLFPGYASDDGIKAGSASATLNKWLGNLTRGCGTTHSFRHVMKDRLRNADVPREVQDRILGHSSGSIGESYGEGFSLAKLQGHLLRVVM